MEKKRKGDILIFEIGRSLDTNTSPAVEKEVNQDLIDGESKMIFDLSKTSYISSAGLRVILSTNRQISLNEGVFRICGINGIVEEIFKVSGFDTFLEIRGSLQEALIDFHDESEF